MTTQQRTLGWALNVLVSSCLMFFITRNVVANIMMDYPAVPEYLVKALTSLPTFTGLFATFAMGSLALRASKVKLLVSVAVGTFAFTMIFFVNGLLHGPFWVYVLACVPGGYGVGGFAPLMNTIIGETFDYEMRAGRIAAYNVANNMGCFVILFLSGQIAAGHGGADWPYAYLLGLYCPVSCMAFVLLMRRSGYRDDAISRVERQTASGRTSDAMAPCPQPSPVYAMARRSARGALALVIGIGFLHCCYYIGINAFYTNVSTWIVHRGLGTAIQTGRATALVRATLIGMSFLYPLWARLLRRWMIPVGYLLGAVGLLGMLFEGSTMMGVYVCSVLLAAGTSLAHSTVYAKALNCVPERLHAISSSLMWGIANAGAFFSAFILAGLSRALGGGMETELVAGIVILIVCAVVAVAVFAIKQSQSSAEGMSAEGVSALRPQPSRPAVGSASTRKRFSQAPSGTRGRHRAARATSAALR